MLFNVRRIVICSPLVLGLATFVTSQARAEPHDPAHASNPSTWCAVHIGRRELPEALSDCDYAVSKRPDDPKARSNRGSLYLLAGDTKAALGDFNVALVLSPTDATLWFNRGLARAKLSQRVDAIADYTRAVELDPNLGIAFHNRGVEHELAGDVSKAAADFRRALEIDPTLDPARRALRRLRGDL